MAKQLPLPATSDEITIQLAGQVPELRRRLTDRSDLGPQLLGAAGNPRVRTLARVAVEQLNRRPAPLQDLIKGGLDAGLSRQDALEGAGWMLREGLIVEANAPRQHGQALMRIPQHQHTNLMVLRGGPSWTHRIHPERLHYETASALQLSHQRWALRWIADLPEALSQKLRGQTDLSLRLQPGGAPMALLASEFNHLGTHRAWGHAEVLTLGHEKVQWRIADGWPRWQGWLELSREHWSRLRSDGALLGVMASQPGPRGWPTRKVLCVADQVLVEGTSQKDHGARFVQLRLEGRL